LELRCDMLREIQPSQTNLVCGKTLLVRENGMKQMIPRLVLLFVCVFGACLLEEGLMAQTAPSPVGNSSAMQQASGPPLAISREAVPDKPLSVIGPRGALLGDQSGRYEAWIFPWKIFSGMRITANVANYAVPIDVNDLAAGVDVKPDHTTITYSHATFTLRQTMMAPKNAPDGAGVLVFYQIESSRPVTLTFSFDPVMQRMWPAASDDDPAPEWFANETMGGFYILHENFPDHAAAVAMPQAQPGIMPPYQERARSWPLQFVLHFDPAKDASTVFPLLLAFANTSQSATRGALANSLQKLNEASQTIAAGNAAYYRDFSAQHTSIETPDPNLNAAFSWAEIAIDQLRVQSTPDGSEKAFTAGVVGSGDVARPGFGWFFGRDALWSLYAVNSYGDYEATREEIEFLLHHQRADGAVMHEWSQTANLVDWKSLPYEYASADATPLLQMAMNDYVKISGDEAFVREHWNELELAWTYETTHDSADGIYNNSSGTGWVESWVPAMPQQELYLAELDEHASISFANLAQATGHGDLARKANDRAARLRTVIENEYYLPRLDFYAFSHNADGTTDDTATIFPAVAWWDGGSLDHKDAMFNRWASSEFSTDWGARILSNRVNFYDPISYHQGTVWPLFTGWLSVAEYRAGRPLAGYVHLMENVDLTWSQDLGSVTELLSGQFYQVLGRSSAHQLWSSAMVISPVLRGMFGLEWDAAHNSLSVTPHLPADWAGATIRQLPFGSSRIALQFTRRGQELIVEASGDGAANLDLRSNSPGARREGRMLHIPLPAVEAAVKQELPAFGQETVQMKVLNEELTQHRLTLTLSAQASSRQTVVLRENARGLHVHSSDAELGELRDGMRVLTVSFPPGPGYVTKSVAIDW
jgi:glycogen debranching enzyme